MNYSKFMNVLYARENLRVHFAGFDFLQSSILYDVLEKFSTTAVLHDQVQIVIVFNHLNDQKLTFFKSSYLEKLNDVRMPDFFQDSDFPVDTVQICMVLYFVFLQDFDSHLNKMKLYFFCSFGYETLIIRAIT